MIFSVTKCGKGKVVKKAKFCVTLLSDEPMTITRKSHVSSLMWGRHLNNNNKIINKFCEYIEAYQLLNYNSY